MCSLGADSLSLRLPVADRRPGGPFGDGLCIFRPADRLALPGKTCAQQRRQVLDDNCAIAIIHRLNLSLATARPLKTPRYFTNDDGTPDLPDRNMQRFKSGQNYGIAAAL